MYHPIALTKTVESALTDDVNLRLCSSCRVTVRCDLDVTTRKSVILRRRKSMIQVLPRSADTTASQPWSKANRGGADGDALHEKILPITGAARSISARDTIGLA